MSHGFLTPIAEVLVAFAAGRPVIMVDEETREDEGDVVVPSELVTSEHIGFMLRECRGLPCVTLSAQVAGRVVLPFQVHRNRSSFQTPFAVSVDHVSVADRGGSASSRAHTIRRLAAVDAQEEEFVTPGNVFPLVAHARGVFGRRGQTEGSFDLARLANLTPSAVICEILDEQGKVRRGKDLLRFSRLHGMSITSVVAVLGERIRREPWLTVTAEAELKTDFGVFRTSVVEDEVTSKEHLVLSYGERSETHSVPLVRVHSECLTGDVFHSERCDCGPQLAQAMRQIVASGYGVVIYLRQEGRGIGLSNKLRAYALQDTGLDTVEANEALGFAADQRDFSVATSILRQRGLDSVRLLTNNPRKISALSALGLIVVERVPLIIPPTHHSRSYLETKRDKLGHLF